MGGFMKEEGSETVRIWEEMGKEGELWDDSALVKAFDDAMSTYKKMHSKSKNKNKNKNNDSNASAPDHEDHEAVREAEDNNVVSRTETEMTGEKNLDPVEENPAVDTHATEPYVDSSNGLATQDSLNRYTFSQGPEDYNQLLSQYYELEEKKQQILQRLNQYGSWNYQFSGEAFSCGAQWGTGSTSQEHPLSASQASYPAVVCSCCPYACQSLLPPCTTYSACSLGDVCSDKACNDTNVVMESGKCSSVVDNDIVKTAMGAVEKAISSMKTNEEANKKKEKEGEIARSISSETDLTVVLNAWYSAGFYTGKYLTEQSIPRNRDN